jgi:hypothetical protein
MQRKIRRNMNMNVSAALMKINTESVKDAVETAVETVGGALVDGLLKLIASFFIVGWSTYAFLLLKASSVFGTGPMDTVLIQKHFFAIGVTPLLLYYAWRVLKRGFYGLPLTDL